MFGAGGRESTLRDIRNDTVHASAQSLHEPPRSTRLIDVPLRAAVWRYASAS
jgi:hypothetical protein